MKRGYTIQKEGILFRRREYFSSGGGTFREEGVYFS